MLQKGKFKSAVFKSLYYTDHAETDELIKLLSDFYTCHYKH